MLDSTQKLEETTAPPPVYVTTDGELLYVMEEVRKGGGDQDKERWKGQPEEFGPWLTTQPDKDTLLGAVQQYINRSSASIDMVHKALREQKKGG